MYEALSYAISTVLLLVALVTQQQKILNLKCFDNPVKLAVPATEIDLPSWTDSSVTLLYLQTMYLQACHCLRRNVRGVTVHCDLHFFVLRVL